MVTSGKKTVVAAVAAALITAACISTGTELMKKTAAESRQAFTVGDYQRAIEAYKEPLRRYPHHRGLLANYAGTVEAIYLAADRAVGRQDFAQAGKTYRVLLDNFAEFKDIAGGITFNRSVLEADIRVCRVSLVDGQARQEVKAGNWAKALGLYLPVFKEYPRDADLASRYQRTVLDIKALGDKARSERNYAQAGQVYALLLREFPAIEERQPIPPLTKADLAAGIAACRENLTKSGLAEYRAGNLAKAIAVWESLLAFDPDNAEIKKAVETAKTQLNAIIKKSEELRTRRSQGDIP